MRVRHFLQTICCLLAIAGSLPALAETHSPQVGAEQITVRVESFMADHISDLQNHYGDNIRIEHSIRSLDSRIKMASCPEPLAASLKSQSKVGRINIKVSCPKTNIWSLYVSVNVDLYRPVVTVINPVGRGSKLEQHNLQMQDFNISRLNGRYFTSMDNIIGMEAKRLIKPGKPLLANNLQPPLLIKKGDSIVMTATSGPLVVKIPATALANGRKGEQIRVKNKQSKRIVEARVLGSGQVTVAM